MKLGFQFNAWGAARLNAGICDLERAAVVGRPFRSCRASCRAASSARSHSCTGSSVPGASTVACRPRPARAPLLLAVAVQDVPVPVAQLHRALRLVRDANRVREDVAARAQVRLLRQVLAAHVTRMPWVTATNTPASYTRSRSVFNMLGVTASVNPRRRWLHLRCAGTVDTVATGRQCFARSRAGLAAATGRRGWPSCG